MTGQTADFRLGAAVHSSDGKHVGKLTRLVMGEDGEVRGLVVQEGRLFHGHLLAPGALALSNEVVVPLASIASADRDRLELGLSAAEVRRLRPYNVVERLAPGATQVFAQMLSSFGGNPGALPLIEVPDKPASELEIEAGENVMLGHTGRKLGRVQDVLIDGSELIGIVLKPEGYFEKDVVLPRRYLERSDDLALFARMTEADLANLEPFTPAD
jgi:sporulation protein YlmC with PRC-barrel domain